MPWCPKCHSEYREGFERCKDCDVDLVAQEPDPAAREAEPREKSWADEVQWVFLANVRDEHEADILENLLNEGGIPVLRKASAGQQAMEMLTGGAMGIDVLVPHTMQADALALLKEEAELDIDEETLAAEGARQPVEEEEDRKGGLYVVGFLVFLVLVMWWVSR